MNPIEIVNEIYKLYGTDSGYLFGLHPEKRDIVEAIVKTTLIIKESEGK